MKKILIFLLIFLSFQTSCLAARISSKFGWRDHPITGKLKFHTGTDFAAKSGTPIHAVFSGEVIWASWRKGYGNTVLLRHPKLNAYTLYGHCSKLLVKPRQRVSAGQTIALVGSSGMSTGPHLHFEYWKNGKYMDPMSLWQKNGKK